MNQLLDRDTLQADSIPLDKSEHFTHGFSLCTVFSIRALRSVFFAENLQSFANHFLDVVEVAGLQLIFDDLFLFRCPVDIVIIPSLHRPDAQENTKPLSVSAPLSTAWEISRAALRSGVSQEWS